VLLRAPVEVVLRRNRAERIGIAGVARNPRAGWLSLADRDKPVRLVEWQAAKDHGVDHREQCGRCADSEGDDDEGGGREAWRRAQGAKCGLEVVAHSENIR